MKAKFSIVAGLMLGAIVAVPAVMANSIVLNQNSYSFADGGEFTALTSPQNFLGGYVPSTILNGGFETFCVEASVTFYPGTTYSFTLSNTDSQGRALTEGAAFLYYEFARGLLTGFDYSNAANRQIDSGELQSAIWNLQGNQSGGPVFPAADPETRSTTWQSIPWVPPMLRRRTMADLACKLWNCGIRRAIRIRISWWWEFPTAARLWRCWRWGWRACVQRDFGLAARSRFWSGPNT